MDRQCLSFGDRFAMFVGKTVIWGSIIWVATSVVRPVIEGVDVTFTIGKEKKDAQQ